MLIVKNILKKYGGLVISIIIFTGAITILALNVRVIYVTLWPSEVSSEERYGPTMNRSYSEITWISDPIRVSRILRDEDAERGFLDEEGKYDGIEITGLSSFDRGEECTIWAYEPIGDGYEDRKYMENLGHEVMHCFRGAYHK